MSGTSYFMHEQLTGYHEAIILLTFLVLTISFIPTAKIIANQSDEILFMLIGIVCMLIDIILLYFTSDIHFLLVTLFILGMIFVIKKSLGLSIKASESYEVINNLEEAYAGHEKELVSYMDYSLVKEYIAKLDRKVIVAEFNEIKRHAKSEMKKDKFREFTEKVYPQLINLK